MTKTLGTLGVLVMLMLGGCSSWFGASAQDPQVALVRVEVVKARLMQQDLRLHFSIDNRNDSTLTVRRLRYKVYVDQWLLAEGESDRWLQVEPGQRGYLVVPVRANLWRHLRELSHRLKQPNQALVYRLKGKMQTGLFIVHDVHLERKGEIIPADFIPEQ